MIDPMLVGFCMKQPKRSFCIYLGWDRVSAISDFIISRYGFEVPFSFEFPDVKELSKTKDWPDRVIIGVLP